MKYIDEPQQQTPIVEHADVLVAGSGPAGIAAAIAAARTGAKTRLIEVHGCLGGVWTAGLLSWIIDAWDKPGIMAEITGQLEQRGARRHRVQGGRNFAYDIEQMKLLLEEMCEQAGVDVRLHTRVTAACLDTNRNLAVVLTESKSGREAWAAKTFVDATGDGDLAARAGCGFDFGNPENGQVQPMSLMALVTGVCFDDIEPCVGGSLGKAKQRLAEKLREGGFEPSYGAPTLFRIRNDLFALMANHQYGVSPMDADQITKATLQARREVHNVVNALRSLGKPWDNLHVMATAEQIGIREGRRVHGRYTVNASDLLEGRRHDDAVCHVNFGMDVHSTDPTKSKSYTEGLPKTQPYDIPLRALIAKDVNNLLLAGRCISGDFLSHASYRVTGNATMLGQAAGVTAALAAQHDKPPHELPFDLIAHELDKFNLAHPAWVDQT